MKKIIIAIGLSFCAQATFAQVEKGMFAVGISSSVSKNSISYENNTPSSSYSYNYKYTTYSILPTINYFISNRFSIGLQVGYTGSTSKSSRSNIDTTYSTFEKGNSKGTSGGITISPNIKYYIPINDNVYFFLKGSCSTYLGNGKQISSNQASYTDPNNGVTTSFGSYDVQSKTKSTDISIGINPGVLFMPSKKIGLEFSLGNIIAYNTTIAKTTFSNSSNTNKNSTNGLEFLNFNSFSVGTSLYYFF